MAGIRIGGVAAAVLCSPPFGAADASGDNNNIYKWCTGDGAGNARNLSGFSDSGATYNLAFDAVLSPDGTKILFVATSDTTGFTEILVMNANGSTPTVLLADASNYYMTPMWGPDSDLFVCVHGSGGTFNGTIETSQVSNPGVVIDTFVTTNGTYSPFRPAYNFDGSRISYFWDKIVNPGCELRVMDADGTNDALLDTITNYRFDGSQSSWALAADMLVYEDGANPPAVYTINGDGTSRTQMNASGDANGVSCRVAHIAWPPGDGYVIIGARTSGVFYNPTRCELDGSGSTELEGSHGGINQIGVRQCLVYNNRVWFIEHALTFGQLGSVALDGSDFQMNLDTTTLGATVGEFLGGWYGDTG